MLDYEMYESFLRNRAILYAIIMFIVLTAIGVCLYFFNTKKEIFQKNMKKVEIICINAVIITILSLALAYTVKYICDTAYDINNQAYVVYEGEFIIDDSKERYITIVDNGQKRVLAHNRSDLPSGTHKGRIIYTKKTELILDCVKLYD